MTFDRTGPFWTIFLLNSIGTWKNVCFSSNSNSICFDRWTLPALGRWHRQKIHQSSIWNLNWNAFLFIGEMWMELFVYKLCHRMNICAGHAFGGRVHEISTKHSHTVCVSTRLLIDAFNIVFNFSNRRGFTLAQSMCHTMYHNSRSFITLFFLSGRWINIDSMESRVKNRTGYHSYIISSACARGCGCGTYHVRRPDHHFSSEFLLFLLHHT